MYDLEKRTLNLAVSVRGLISQLPKTIANIEDAKQLARSSGSVGANYIEANEALSKKDFLMRLRISRKEAKETAYWLMIIQKSNNLDPDLVRNIDALINESVEIKCIFSSIINKSGS
jgi:four helix bundle protein